MKKLFSLVLIAAVLLSLFPAVAATEATAATAMDISKSTTITGSGYGSFGFLTDGNIKTYQKSSGSAELKLENPAGIASLYLLFDLEYGEYTITDNISGKVYTAACVGTVLPGVTRRSCIEVLKSKGYNVSERLLSIDELAEALENGTLEEAWGCGTAAVVSPIGQLFYKGEGFTVGNGGIGEVTQKLYDTLTGIQWGRVEDTFGWTMPLDK